MNVNDDDVNNVENINKNEESCNETENNDNENIIERNFSIRFTKDDLKPVSNADVDSEDVFKKYQLPMYLQMRN